MVAILQLDVAGTPQNWLTPNDVASLYCSGSISWSLSPMVSVVHGGYNQLGDRTIVEIPAIVATTGIAKVNQLLIEPNITRRNLKLFARDRYMCAYCGDVFVESLLTREHIIPVSRGGEDHWMNTVCACKKCNNFKSDRLLSEVNMELLYLPYIPNRFEDFLLQRGNKTIIADQMEFLLPKIPKHSRIHIS